MNDGVDCTMFECDVERKSRCIGYSVGMRWQEDKMMGVSNPYIGTQYNQYRRHSIMHLIFMIYCENDD